MSAPLQLTGYILEPPRVGGSNSPFTLTPDNLISNPGTFAAAYPTTETAPRTEYMIQVLREATGAGTGPGNAIVLPDALFAWTKNEGALQAGLSVPFERFTYAGHDQVFKPLQGAPREVIGTLETDANTVRLGVAVAPLLTNLSDFPVRISLGSVGSGTTFTVSLVPTFSVASPGTVQMNPDGELHWNAADIATNAGSTVYYQRQTFYKSDETTGIIGVLGTGPLMLNPLPRTGQIPALKIGSRNYLTAIERATEGALSGNPAASTVEWAADTGLLKFNATTVTSLLGQPVVYDGAFIGTFQVSTAAIGPAEAAPCGILAPLPSEESDTYFRIPGVVQFPETVFVDTFSAGKEGQVQIRRSDGAVQLSAADRGEYSGSVVQVVRPDVSIERGVSVRLFRSPVNPAATTAGVKDVTAFYVKTDAVLADPIIGQPFVFLPALPREDATLTVRVSQGTGSFVGELQRLDVASPPTGKGYTLDFESRQLSYAERKAGQVLPASAFDFSAVHLPNAPVLPTGLVVELENNANAEDFVTQVEGRDFVIDLGSGVVTYTQTEGEVLLSGIAELSDNTFTVASDLTAAGVAAGDLLVIVDGDAKGLYQVGEVQTPTTATVTPSFPGEDIPPASYEIRSGKEVLADRFFRDVPLIDPNTSVERINALGTITNSPRLSINKALADRVRFRFGKTTFSTATSIVSSFTAPGSLAVGVVEVNSDTGELNFSQSDVAAGGSVYWCLKLILGSEYKLQPELGFIEFADRMLQNEETHLRYMVFDADGNTKIPVEERGSFLVPKEVVQPHPAPASTLSFNPAGREIASTPAPTAFRGGRPQSTSQVQFDVSAGTVTFVGDSVVTDALPHGAIVGPSENVYIDYYIHEAIGGEKNLSVARPPMATVQVILAAEDDDGVPQSSFTIEGDRTSDFQAQYLLEVDGTDAYLLEGSTFDGTVTTVSLDQTAPQLLRSDALNPPLRVTSGAVRRLTVGHFGPYFTLEGAPYDTIARGSKQIRLAGDLSRAYSAGTILVLTDSLTFQEYHLVEGATYDAESDRTTLVLKSGVSRQCSTPTVLLKSLRPILGASVGSVSTATSPLLNKPFTVYRKVEGQIGRLLTRDADYTIDDSGRVTFVDGLALQEELGIFYTGVSVIDAERRTRASWTFAIVPTAANGLEGQRLTMDYSTYIPDTFFYRVETITNYRAELSEQFSNEAKAASPSQGPVLENSGGTPLFEQGNPSLFFDEGDLDNQDLVARMTLLGFNNVINDIESFVEALTGKAVGDHDGRFLFDGNLDNPARTLFAYATNQIDDLIQVFGSTPKRAFEAANYSRFYPTQRVVYGAAADPTGLATGEPILDLNEGALRAVVAVRNRSPWAVTTQAAPAGSTVFQVDHAQGDAYLLRPGLNVTAGLKVAITRRDGTSLVADGTPATVASTTPTSVTLSAPVPVVVPKGATIRMASTDDAHRQNYRLGIDLGVDMPGGFLTHISNEDIPSTFVPNLNPEAGTLLDVLMQVGATNTAPERFPALDGGTVDDDGNRQFPALSIDGGAELGSAATELALINAATGTLATNVTPSFTGAGTVTSSTTVTGTFVAPVPKVGDLFRVLTGGSEGGSYYHRIASVAGSTLTIEPALNISSGAITFEVTVASALVTSVGSLSDAVTLEDPLGDFVVNGVKPGHTVVATSGAFVGERRQVATVNFANQLTVSSPFTGTGAITYQIVDCLATFGAPASLQQSWIDALVEEVRSLEGQDFVDFSERLVEEVTAQTATISAISMGAFSSLLVFVALDNNGTGSTAITAATFNGAPLALLSTATSGDFGLYTYLAQGVKGITGNLVITATDTSVSLKVFALKLSGVKNSFGPTTVGTAVATSMPATLGVAGLSSAEAGDLVVSFVFSGVMASEIYPLEGHDTLIPRFNANGMTACLTVTRATGAKQVVAPQFRVRATPTRALMATVVLTKDVAADPIPGRALSEKGALERLFNDAAPDRGLGNLVGAITGASTMTGNFTNVGPQDALFVRHGANAGVYTVISATDTTATIAGAFPAAPETAVVFRAGSPSLVAIDTLEEVFAALESVETALVDAGSLLLRHHCPILVYRNGTAADGLPGTSDSAFTESSGRLVLEGAYARPISSLIGREAALTTRVATTDHATLESALSSGRLYDGRYVWIDSRINLETGILPKKDRAVANRQRALETIIKNLTKQLTT